MIRTRTFVFMLLAVLATTSARAAESPSAERRAALAAAIDSATFVRVVARQAVFESRQARADSLGVHLLRTSGRSALIATGAAGREERLLAWNDIRRIETGRASSAAPLVAGVALGGMLTTVALAGAGDTGGESAAIASIWAVPLGIAIAATGLFLSVSHSGMRTVFP